METGFCSTDGCDNESTKMVPVSLNEAEIETRELCDPCEEAYATGCQHGHYRAVRNVRAMGHDRIADQLSACLGEPETHTNRASSLTTHVAVWAFADADNDIVAFVGRYDHPPTPDEVKRDAYLWAHDEYEPGGESLGVTPSEFDAWHDSLCQVGGVQITEVA